MRDTLPKSSTEAPLCKGSCHGEAVTEGLYTVHYWYNPSVKTCGFDTSLKVNCPEGAREGGLGHYTREALAQTAI